jgi:hypothetical protein
MNNIVRQNAAEVMGEGISGASTEKKPSRSKIASRSLLLFGNGRTGERGSVTRIHWYLLELRKSAMDLHIPYPEISKKIAATKIAIRRCLAYLEDAHFGNFDLTRAALEGADMQRAVFKNALLDLANLEGADLRFANIDAADLRCADLRNAKLGGLENWSNSKIAYANVRGVHADDAFKKWALREGALDMETSAWKLKVMSSCTLQALGLQYTE